MESLLDLVYKGGWPARAWARFGRADRVSTVTVKVSAPPGVTPLRIAFASDLHLGPTTAEITLDRAFQALEDARPDALLLGGDYVFLHATPRKARELARRVARVPAASKWAVLGNHDLWSAHGLLERALEDVGVKILVNDSGRLPAPHGDVAVVGVDDPWTGAPDPGRAFSGVGDARVVIVLCHAAEGLPMVSPRRFDLFLCGHTHGGHVATPRGALYAPGHVGRELVSGEHRTPWGRAFLSRGVGATEVPFRTWARPDVVLADVG